MKKKKVLKVILFIVLAIILVFLVINIRKMLIIKDLCEKVEKYETSNNYYEKITNNSGSITEFYCKENNQLLVLNTTTQNEEKRKMYIYTKNGTKNTYIESGTEKVALLNNDNVLGSVNIISLKYNNLWDLFTMSIFTSIKDGQYKGKECYILSFSKSDEIYIEKETGLRVYAKDGTITDEEGNTVVNIVEYEYEFENVDDKVFIEPNIEEYEVQEND